MKHTHYLILFQYIDSDFSSFMRVFWGTFSVCDAGSIFLSASQRVTTECYIAYV